MNAYFLTVIDVHWIVEVKSPFMMYLVCYCATASHKVTLPSITAQVIYTLSWPRYVLTGYSSCTLCNQEWQDALYSCYKISTCLICFSSDNQVHAFHFQWAESEGYIYPLPDLPFYTFSKKIEIKGTETMWIFLHILDTQYSPQKFVLTDLKCTGFSER